MKGGHEAVVIANLVDQALAFRQIGETKIAAFVVVNAYGAVTDRDGNLVKCSRAAGWGVPVVLACRDDRRSTHHR